MPKVNKNIKIWRLNKTFYLEFSQQFNYMTSLILKLL